MEQREQSVRVTCPQCGATLLVKNTGGASERKVNCPKCQQPISVNFATAEPLAHLAPPAPVPPAPGPTPSVAPMQPQSSGKNKAWLIGLLSGLVVILAGVLVWFLLHKDKPKYIDDDATESVSVATDDVSVSVVSSVPEEKSKKSAPVIYESSVPYDSEVSVSYATERVSLTGYMINKGQRYPIALTYTNDGGTIYDCTYKNTNYGTKINMSGTQSYDELYLEGYDGSKRFIIRLQRTSDGWDGYSTVGSQSLVTHLD